MIAVALARYLTSLELVDFRANEAGGDCFINRMPASPDEAVCITGYGASPLAASMSLAWDEPTVQIRVRGTADPRTGDMTAQSLYAALQGLTSTIMDPGGDDEAYVAWVRALQTAPFYIGADELGRHEYTLNIALRVRAVTTHRA